jgi:hypothetical protein
VKYTTKKHLDIGASESKVPDKKWLIDVLSIFDYENEIFKKDYLPPIKEPTKEEMVVDNGDNLYTNLPKLFKKKDTKAISKLKGYK